MTTDDLPFDQVSLLPEDWDELEDGEIEIPAFRLADLDDSAERL